ncbi:MAG: DegQ family serine endoprotease [Alphaproteobacteria bacterium]|nr:DegQ family serine endoprotease [Alphaproteobacteria bacterium]
MKTCGLLKPLARAGLALSLLAFAAGPLNAQPQGAPTSFADLAESLLPAVVNVSTTQTVSAKGGPEMPQFPPGSPFEEFFKDFLEKQRPDGARPHKATSLGSGFIIDPDGLVVTNNHVIADADEVNVILHDNSTLKAEIVGRDAKTDIALLRIKPNRPLTALKFGDSDIIRVGDWVLAIGNPFGLGGTVTAGIISARQRDINSGPYDDFLQTDAAINRGNSGGPMFNMKGEVIGINTAIYSPSGGSVGIGFAIPSTLAKPVIEDLKKFGRTKRGWLGVHIQTVNDEIADNLGIKDKDHRGALVASVTPKGPAEKAGIKGGDVILSFDGKKVTEMRRLPRIVAETPVGKSVDVVLLRQGKTQTVKVTVAELEDDESKPGKRTDKKKDKSDTGPASKKVGELGLSVSPPTAEVRQKFELAEETKGLVVTSVDPSGPAAEKGIKPGNVILEAGQTPMSQPGDLTKRVEDAKSSGAKTLLLLIDGPNGPGYVVLKLDKK